MSTLDKLTELSLKENTLKRLIDSKVFYDLKKRTKLYNELKETQKDIKKYKTLLKLERELKNANNNTDRTKNEEE